MVITESNKEAIKSQLGMFADNKQDSKDANERNRDIIDAVARSIALDKKVVRKAFTELLKLMDDGESDLDAAVEFIQELRD